MPLRYVTESSACHTPALTQLRALRYFTEIPALDTQLLDWLLLEDSMTKRFEQQGKTVSVTDDPRRVCRAE
ncbi:chorismate lyase [Escherichia coli]|uniref:Chorismate lyase n=1 Tax=Escherichia coli TaxID=562 RepID=A0A376MNK1_ECOLX|nr:chorismate lyase [Escherichia coli]